MEALQAPLCVLGVICVKAGPMTVLFTLLWMTSTFLSLFRRCNFSCFIANNMLGQVAGHQVELLSGVVQSMTGHLLSKSASACIAHLALAWAIDCAVCSTFANTTDWFPAVTNSHR
jgi:hypothetical protein